MMDPTSADTSAPDEPDDNREKKHQLQGRAGSDKHENEVDIDKKPIRASSSRPVVHYRSTALEEMGMVTNRDVHKVPAVMAAAETAERVREEYKKKLKNENENNIDIHIAGGKVSKAVRYDRRTKLNRDSAAASRVRKEAYIAALEQELMKEDTKKKELLATLRDERSAHNKLKKEHAAVSSTCSVKKEEDIVADSAIAEPGNGGTVGMDNAASIDPEIVDQIFFHQPASHLEFPTPSTDVVMNMGMDMGMVVGSASNLQRSSAPPMHILPDDLLQLDLPFAPIPSRFLDDTSPQDPNALIDEMLEQYPPNHNS